MQRQVLDELVRVEVLDGPEGSVVSRWGPVTRASADSLVRDMAQFHRYIRIVAV
jgi:hypothetical protein